MNLKNLIILFFIIIGICFPAFAQENIDTMYAPPQMSQNEILFSQSRRQVDVVNPTPYSNPAGKAFPGARGANQLILYTSAYGERTHTNEFGTEAIIEGNTVVELGGADSFIPDGGAVISGHGTAKSWISSNITVGTKVYYDDMTGVLTTYTTSNSYMFEAMQKIEEANSMIEYYKTRNYDYDWKVPTGYIKEAQEYMRKAEKNPNQVKQYSKQAIEAANHAIKSVLPFRTNEFKGVWLRPTETSPSAIAESVKKIKNAGIDNIFIETYFHGKTIYPSLVMEDLGFIKQNESFIGFDPLKVWIKEAHKNGIKVHIWFETFYVGNTPPYTNPESILAVHPEWGNKTLNGYASSNATPSASEHNGYFLDPSNQQVQEFLERLLTEIIIKYEPDGINLDYIRYPQSISSSPSGNWGYTENARKIFAERFGVDPVTLTTNDSLWYEWSRFRREQVTNFVRSIGNLARERNVYLSAVIFPDRSVAYSRKLQDWASWSKNHYLNGFTPLFLTCDSKTLNSQIATVKNYKEPETDLFAGLFVTFMGGSEEDLIRQIHETRKLNVNGVILFDYAHLSEKYVNALSARVFANNSKSNGIRKQNPATKLINWNQPVQQEKQDQLHQMQNNRMIIQKYDPNKMQSSKNPTPIIVKQKRR